MLTDASDIFLSPTATLTSGGTSPRRTRPTGLPGRLDGEPAAWRCRLARLDQLDMPAARSRIVVLAAHPHDETLGAGGILGRAAELGHETEIIIASDGEASHPASPTQRPSILGALHRTEARAAAKSLAPAAKVTFLSLPDGQLSDAMDELGRAVDEAVGEGAGWLVAPWLGDRDPDHEACAIAARRVAADHPNVREWEYPLWAWSWAVPGSDDLPDEALRRVPSREGSSRNTALDCYHSLTEPLSELPGDEALLSAGFAVHFYRRFDVLIDTQCTESGLGARVG